MVNIRGDRRRLRLEGAIARLDVSTKLPSQVKQLIQLQDVVDGTELVTPAAAFRSIARHVREICGEVGEAALSALHAAASEGRALALDGRGVAHTSSQRMWSARRFGSWEDALARCHDPTACHAISSKPNTYS